MPLTIKTDKISVRNGNSFDSADLLMLDADLDKKIDEPETEGSPGQVLTTDGKGGRSWTNMQIEDYTVAFTGGYDSISSNRSMMEITNAASAGKHVIGTYNNKTYEYRGNFVFERLHSSIDMDISFIVGVVAPGSSMRWVYRHYTPMTYEHFTDGSDFYFDSKNMPIQNLADPTNSGDAANKNYVDTIASDKQDELTFDIAPTANSNNPVTSGGVKTELDKKISEPSSDGSNGQVLTTDGSGGRSWTTVNLPSASDPLPVGSGGTGATTAVVARQNLNETYTAGTYTLSGKILNGFITNASRSVYLQLITPRSLYGITNVTISDLSIAIRTVSGQYLGGNSASTDWVAMSGMTVSAVRTDYHEIRITIVANAALTNATNNTPIVGYGDVTFTLS